VLITVGVSRLRVDRCRLGYRAPQGSETAGEQAGTVGNQVGLRRIRSSRAAHVSSANGFQRVVAVYENSGISIAHSRCESSLSLLIR
jgi:hypothetical protein